MDAVFKEVKVEKVSDKIVNQLIDLITEGKLLPGEKLPSERRLTDLFGVGRSSLREALNTLETLGFIEIKKRKGNYVKNMDGAVALNPLKKIMQVDQKRIVELYEVRRSIEQSSAREAAENRTGEDLAAMHKALHLFNHSAEKLVFSWDDEIAFHLAIARASHNFLRLHTLKSIFDFAREFLEPVLHGFICSEERMNTVFSQHTAIYEAIEAQDKDLSRHLMREHLFGTNKKLSDFFQEKKMRLL
ncbi:FadR/GntR family transcriptional regulator [Desulfopila sp. IMCC35008]|uniref:FadR/GntR family transcriptional regulator n=1 Tax=Desulfopila sp. IMCC35008 TaxID=2653858 RepID=UPI0013CF6B67|nr:FadR/GntR family transcriptional regulator [Desulfopila sp. IMCC35008]